MGAPLGFKTFATGDVLTAADTNGYLMQGVWAFANAAARTAAVTSPQEGNMSYLKDTDSVQYYSGSAWVAVAGASSSGLTFIRRTTFSATAEATIETVFDTTYNTYLVIVEAMTAATGTDNGQIRMRRNTTPSTSAIYGMLTSAKYNDTTIQFTGKTNSDAMDISTYTDGMSAALWFNNVGTGTSVTARAHGTSVNPAQGENGTIGFTCADAQNWNGFSLRSASSTVTGAVTIYGLAKA
jgi:hypothetical protein